MKYTKQDYLKAIAALHYGIEQLEPDGNNCAICGDCGHQAWECHHNPLNERYIQRTVWRCFHCGEILKDPEEARKHFGNISEATPLCVLKKGLCLQCPCKPIECQGKGNDAKPTEQEAENPTCP